MAIDIEQRELVKAVRHPANFKPLVICSVLLIVMAILIILCGILVMIFDHIELGPPHYDKIYTRYSGTNLGHIIGKLSYCGFCFSSNGANDPTLLNFHLTRSHVCRLWNHNHIGHCPPIRLRN